MVQGRAGSTRWLQGPAVREGGVQGPNLQRFRLVLPPSGSATSFLSNALPLPYLGVHNFCCRKSYTLPGGVSSPADGPSREVQEFQTFGDGSHQISGAPEMCGVGNPEPEYLALKHFPASERPRPSSLFVSKRAFLRGVFQPSPTVPGSLPTTPSDLRTGPPGNARSRLETP